MHCICDKLIVGYAVPVQLSGRTLVYGQNFQFQYVLPQNATFFTEFFENSSRRRRENVNWDERMTVYRLLEEGFERWELLLYFEYSLTADENDIRDDSMKICHV